MSKPVQRYPRVPWGDIAPSDLVPAGMPEYLYDSNRETHVGMQVETELGSELGWIALRCQKQEGRIVPLTLAMAEPVV